MEYGIFQKSASTRYLFNFWNMEYSQKNGNKKNIEIGGIWNIRRIFQKILKQSKYPKFRNMEYSIEYSWNIKKKSERLGA